MPIVDPENLPKITCGRAVKRMLLCLQNLADLCCGAVFTPKLYRKTRRLNNNTLILLVNIDSRSTAAGTAKVMTYDDIFEAHRKNDVKEATITSAKQKIIT